MIIVVQFKEYENILISALTLASSREDFPHHGVNIASSCEFKLNDSWFGSEPRSIETVAAALTKHCGITITTAINPYGNPLITRVIVTNENQYQNSVVKDMNRRDSHHKQYMVGLPRTRSHP